MIPPGDTALLRPDSDSGGRQKVLGNEEPPSPILEGGGLHRQEHGEHKHLLLPPLHLRDSSASKKPFTFPYLTWLIQVERKEEEKEKIIIS